MPIYMTDDSWVHGAFFLGAFINLFCAQSQNAYYMCVVCYSIQYTKQLDWMKSGQLLHPNIHCIVYTLYTIHIQCTMNKLYTIQCIVYSK